MVWTTRDCWIQTSTPRSADTAVHNQSGFFEILLKGVDYLVNEKDLGELEEKLFLNRVTGCSFDIVL